MIGFYIGFFNCFSVDKDNTRILQSILLASGKGRPPKLPNCEFTNCLILQLIYLKEETGVSWDRVGQLFCRLFPGIGLQQSAFYRIRVRCLKAAIECPPEQDREFLCNVPEQLDSAGAALDRLGVQKSDLLGEEDFLRDLLRDRNLTNEILFELVLFMDKNKLTWRHLFKWMDCFGITFRIEANGKNVLIRLWRDTVH